jgi:hypothetical protein
MTGAGAEKRDLALKLGAHCHIDSSTQNPSAEMFQTLVRICK